MTRYIDVTLDGETFRDQASGNTPAALRAALAALIRSYERDGATVVIVRPKLKAS